MKVFKVQKYSLNYVFPIKTLGIIIIYSKDYYTLIKFFIIDKGNKMPFFNNIADVNIEYTKIMITELSL